MVKGESAGNGCSLVSLPHKKGEGPNLRYALTNFVRSTIDSLEEGLRDRGFQISGSIEFELAVVNTRRAEGGLKLVVVDASGRYDRESVSKIKFKLRRKREGS